MPRAIQSTFFEPFIHGLDVMLARAERVIGGERAERQGRAKNNDRHRDLVNLPGLVEQVVAYHQAVARARGVRFFVDVAPDALVVGDAFGLHRVLDRLVSWELEDTPPGGCVTISGSASQGVVSLSFSSQPPEPPTGDHTRMADGFRKTQLAQPTPKPGMCVGKIREILQTHHGRLEVCSPANGGSRFVIFLPVDYHRVSNI